jgi:hypothetical protein
VKSPIVVPIHPCHSGHVDFILIVPRPLRFYQLGLVQADRGFRERVVQRVADRADRRVDTGID